MEETYNVVYSGHLQPGAEMEETLDKLVAATKMDRAKATALLSANKPVVFKKGVPQDVGEKYVRGLSRIGMHVRLEAVPPSPPAPEPDAAPAASAPPASGASAVTADNPYAAPQADLRIDTGGTVAFRSEPLRVPASHGLRWIKGAAHLFWAKPGTWIGIFVVEVSIVVILGLIPIVGNFLKIIIQSILSGGVMIGAHSLRQTDELRVSHLFAGFRQNTTQLSLVGLFSLVFTILAFVITLLPIGAGLWPLFSRGTISYEGVTALIIANWQMGLLGILIGLSLFTVLTMALFFAPSLVAIVGKTGFSSMKASFRATTRNWRAFLIYGLVLIGFGIGVIIVISIVVVLLSRLLHDGSWVFIALFFGFLAVIFIGFPLMIIFTLSVYTSFRDIFFQEAGLADTPD